jgi:hypothetical protein
VAIEQFKAVESRNDALHAKQTRKTALFAARGALHAAALGVLTAVPSRKWGVMCICYEFLACIKELRRRAAASPLAVAGRLAPARHLRVHVLVEGFVKKLLRRASARPAAVERRYLAELKALALKKKCARRVIIFKSSTGDARTSSAASTSAAGLRRARDTIASGAEAGGGATSDGDGDDAGAAAAAPRAAPVAAAAASRAAAERAASARELALAERETKSRARLAEGNDARDGVRAAREATLARDAALEAARH